MLKVNGSEVSDREFVVDYLSSGNEISATQFKSLDERPKGPREGVIEAGYFTDKRYADYRLNDTEIRRVVKIKVKGRRSLSSREFAILDDSTRSEIIDSGHFNHKNTNNYNLTDEERTRAIKGKIKNINGDLFSEEFDSLDDSIRSEVIDSGYFNKKEYDEYNLTDEEIRRIIKLKIKNKHYIYPKSPKEFSLLDYTNRNEVIDSGYFNEIYYYEFEDYKLTNEEMIRIVKLKIKNGYYAVSEGFDLLDDSDRSEAIDSGYFNKKDTSRYNLTDEEIRRIEARRGQPVNESINMMKRMNLL